MKWKDPQHGDQRVKTFFAWFPTWLRRDKCNVWLETVTVEQQYDEWHDAWLSMREVPLNFAFRKRHDSI